MIFLGDCMTPAMTSSHHRILTNSWTNSFRNKYHNTSSKAYGCRMKQWLAQGSLLKIQHDPSRSRVLRGVLGLLHGPSHGDCERGGFRIVEDSNNNNQPWGRKGTLPYTLACTVKSRPSPNVTPNDQERRMERGRCFLLARAGLSSYLSWLCTMCVSLPRLGSGFHSTTA